MTDLVKLCVYLGLHSRALADCAVLLLLTSRRMRQLPRSPELHETMC